LVVTSPFLGFIRRFRLPLAAGALGISVALVAAIFRLTPEKAVVRIPPAAQIVPVAAPAEPPEMPPPEPVAMEPPAEPPAENPPPMLGNSTVLEGTASHVMPSQAPSPEPTLEEVNRYLWTVYERSAIKHDGSGDFTWKDVAAAARLAMSRGDYVIRGMDPDFRELLYRAGLAMDAAHVGWTIRSAFRDDYRQGLAAGYKARTDNSLHGGSAATGGYGHGCAVDIAAPEGKSDTLWKWLDANGAQLGLQRAFPGVDPSHVLPRGAWHELAAALRDQRLAEPAEPGSAAVADLAAIGSAPPSEADSLCINVHRLRDEMMLARAAKPAGHPVLKLAARAHGTGKPSNER
jgi:hypothetical protein